MNGSTKSRKDAYERVLVARMGSLADRPSSVYLEALKRELYTWTECIDEELAKAHDREQPDGFDLEEATDSW